MSAYDQDVERELMRGEMKLVCAWHPKYFGVEKVMREAEPGASEYVTSGICSDCVEILHWGRATWAARKEKEAGL